jgi:glycyl-tRNA synthetase
LKKGRRKSSLKVSNLQEKVAELAKRRGFFWQAYEIYGGVSGLISFGPLGTVLRNNIEEKWRRVFVRSQAFMEIDTPIVTPNVVFEASGHVENFKEPMTECSNCGRKFRADHILQEQANINGTETEKMNLKEIDEKIVEKMIKCPECGGTFKSSTHFMTMFKTTIGPYSEGAAYMRPEAAQGMFVEFRRLGELARDRLPFGVSQIGKVMRNEISPRQGPIRLREFTIMESEIFFDPENPSCPRIGEVEGEGLNLLPVDRRAEGVENAATISVSEALEKGYIKTEWQAYFMVLSKKFLEELGVPSEKQRFIEKLPWERAHYSLQGYDQEILLDRWGWVEVSGHNYRSDYDLSRHMNQSKMDLRMFRATQPVTKEIVSLRPRTDKIGRAFGSQTPKILALLGKADPAKVEKALIETGRYAAEEYEILPEYVEFVKRTETESGKRFLPHVVEPSFGTDRIVYVVLQYAYSEKDDRTILRLPRQVAPVQVSVFPLMGKDGLREKAQEIYKSLLAEDFAVEFDESGSIGRRYARMDEIGVPLAVTVDYQSLDDDTVTVRDRDTWDQSRKKISELITYLRTFYQTERI